jgi:CHASE3 domain sensor protein
LNWRKTRVSTLPTYWKHYSRQWAPWWIRKNLTLDPTQQSRLDELNELAKNWRASAEREIALMAKPETREDARALESSTAGKTAMDRVRAKADEINAVEGDLLERREAVQKQAFVTDRGSDF